MKPGPIHPCCLLFALTAATALHAANPAMPSYRKLKLSDQFLAEGAAFRPISPPGAWQRFTHGPGLGDVNGDGRKDILEKNGWWEQPASLQGNPLWQHHAFAFVTGRGGAQMYAYIVSSNKRGTFVFLSQKTSRP